jgi:hypothetical protein
METWHPSAWQMLFASDIIFQIPDKKTQPAEQPSSGVPQPSSDIWVWVSAPSAAELVLLNKILQAVKYSLETIQLFDSQTIEAPERSLIWQQHQAQKVLFFGVLPSQVGLPDLDLTPYTPHQHAQTTYVLADSLAHLETQVSQKKRLWEVLKQLF